MNQQEQATKHAAIFQDTINGTNDPTPWPVTMWASSGDTIWTAGTARTAGEDSVGMIYDPGDTIVHRNTIAGDVTRATESFAIRPADCFASMFVRQVRQCFSVVWADGFPRCRHRFPVM
ncbi:hypothetical protein MCC10095_1916 [Bifidobacterium longum subsp. longum]|uniref:hypothetical protein n=1 Tax=Bifidobacterium longum TaxID=216816 RepID=UPI001039659A|nr:hypothetical protein [Bifidobacterium longum]TCF30149.1 hypothetical protein MCC10095_1916 [Bifidobacterium longum subsp. longum]